MAEEVKKTEEVEVVEKEEQAVAEQSSAAEAKKKKKRAKQQILKGQAHIKCTYNNTMVTISDLNGGILGWSSSGLLGFKGAKKATPYAATQVVGDVSEKVKKYGIQELEVYVKGVGSGREASIRGLANRGFDIQIIKDVTPIPHNGCRPKKPRRV
ncbi:MAG: 30S ribosomal protein S11 [Candidatus Moranbacteria bacterium GW2011_GWE1_49_15]|nr:MAG: 30S ribosomal protein S11 [Candidatus Moranbacteria bacterium GW2011_GWE2_47_10]KKW07598.1 MAG: 30S ribosomal protein S11 [Candidatus Moranbacteria bacterium GW2011_GWE1_49_15]HBP01068.1 30S ribosomal protein S11 [Candidatus Moranbacteria bacterium]